MRSKYEKKGENGSSIWCELCGIKDGYKFFGIVFIKCWGLFNFFLNWVNLWFF